MEIIINFEPNNDKAISLIKFLKTLDFIHVKNNVTELSQPEIDFAEEGIKDFEEGNYSSYENVLLKAKQKYPKLFE